MGKHHTGTVEIEIASNMMNGKIGLARNVHDVTLFEFGTFEPNSIRNGSTGYHSHELYCGDSDDIDTEVVARSDSYVWDEMLEGPDFQANSYKASCGCCPDRTGYWGTFRIFAGSAAN